MKYYSQRDDLWRYETLGFSTTKIGSYGCKLTCFSIIDERNPLEMNQLFKDEEAFVGDLLYDTHCAVALGWDYEGIVYSDPKRLCIAEVDFNPDPDKDQHFVVWLGNGRIIDPWYGVEMDNPYKVYSYRLFNIKEEKMKEEFVGAISDLCGKDYGKNINDNEQEEAAGIIVKHLIDVAETELTLSDLIESNKTVDFVHKQTIADLIEEHQTELGKIESKQVLNLDTLTFGQVITMVVSYTKSKLNSLKNNI